ncbi:dynamin family protein [Paenibacillus sp. N3.4]|uniref:dynamin family protein n=1 Tax=Paenibacillus sp. N3.4 TaxID=2603222 RepID=UPI0011CAAEBA|nr:dynamin family protein [Paenibacillus sp. N3.4]TXK82562.1 GTPase [Paenibacillus sp. N3.4]
MAKFFIKYNPFTVESFMTINNQEVTAMSKLYNYRNERFQLWLENLLPILVDECNDDELDITFHGTLLDYDDLLEQIHEYSMKNPSIKVSVEHIESQASTARFKELSELFEYMQSECPFEDLRDEQIKENFYKALSSEFEVSVIATMSSGKSTLINAMLRSELMPAKNEACTATIARIKDVDGQSSFSAICRNAHNAVVCQYEEVDLETMQQLNNNPEVSYIDIEGDIPFITSKSVELVLLDTPGPNNSRSEEHREHTYRIIKEKAMPMVLYVLNATQLATNDDNALLKSVAKAMRVGGKQSKDRFIFAVNKIDTFDTESESLSGALQNVKDYLGKHGIENPNIYPISAEMAKVIRLNQNGASMTTKQRVMMNSYHLFNEIEQMHLSAYAPLTQKNKDLLDEIIQTAKSNEDPYAEALVHTGLPAVEIAINEYLDKYAITAKVKTAVDTFRKKVEEKKLYSHLMDELKENNQAREELNERLKKVEKQLNDGKLASVFRDKIRKLDMVSEANNQVGTIRAKITNTMKITGSFNHKMTIMEAEQFMNKLVRDIEYLQSDVKTDLEKLVDEIIVDNATQLIKEYEHYIQSLIEDEAIHTGRFQTDQSITYLAGTVPDAKELIKKYEFSEEIKTGEKEVDNPKKKGFFGKLKFWQPGKITRNVYESRDFVDQEILYTEFVRPITGDFNEILEEAKVKTQEEAEKFKNFFLKELDKLDMTLKKKVLELQELSGNQQLLEQKISENHYKKVWLDDFSDKLNQILDV